MHRLMRFLMRFSMRFLKSRASQRGVALIMVLGLLALVGSVVSELQFSTHVDVQLAYNARDELQAEYNALSALRLRALLLKQSRKLQGGLQALMGALGNAAALPPLGRILEMIPVECGLMSAITKPVEGIWDMGDRGKMGAMEKMAHTEKTGQRSEGFFPGTCHATSQSEHGKIAINLLRNPINNRAQQVGGLLLGFLLKPQMSKYFQSDDRNGQYVETPVALVHAIADWIDADHREQDGLTDEDRRYQYLKEPYRVKNAPFDSLQELGLVYGINDDLYDRLKTEVTIYNDNPALDLATAPIDRIVYAGLPAVLREDASMEALLAGLPALIAQIQAWRQLGGAFAPLTVQTLTGLVQEANLGRVVDTKKLGSVFTDSASSTWYTLSAEGQLGRATRRIHVVFQVSEGQFYYARVE